MNIDTIEAKIKKALAHEKSTHLTLQAIRNLAGLMGRTLTAKDEQEVIGFLTEYIWHVPLFLRQGQNEAGRRGIGGFEAVLSAVSEYWMVDNDVLPDHLGLLGAMDDAYYSLCLLQNISEQCLRSSGTPLLGVDLSQANQAMRNLIGEPWASQLDALIAQQVGAVASPNFLEAIQRMVMQMGPMMGTGRDPMWGNASMNDIVNARLGAMGVVR